MSQQAVKFAYWVPNVSGGLVVSKIEQRTDWALTTTASWRNWPRRRVSNTP